MTKTSNQTKGSSSKKKPQSHVYRGIRDIILNDARGTTVSTLNTTSGGNASINGAFVPMALTVPQSVSGGTSGTYDTVVYPRCNWLTSTAKNFQSYRLTRAVLIFVGNAGSTNSGTVNMMASRDFADVTTGIQTAYVVGRDAKSFDLASSSTKELRLPMPVDTSWKKVTSELAILGNNGYSGTQYSVVPCNTVNDLIATSFGILVVGGPASTNIGNAFIEYDIEFRDPVAIAVNY